MMIFIGLCSLSVGAFCFIVQWKKNDHLPSLSQSLPSIEYELNAADTVNIENFLIGNEVIFVYIKNFTQVTPQEIYKVYVGDAIIWPKFRYHKNDRRHDDF